jgi:hypothetical protein
VADPVQVVVGGRTVLGRFDYARTTKVSSNAKHASRLITVKAENTAKQTVRLSMTGVKRILLHQDRTPGISSLPPPANRACDRTSSRRYLPINVAGPK